MMIISRWCFKGALRPACGAWAWLVCAAVLGLAPMALGQSSITNDCFVMSCPPDRMIFICNGTYEFVEPGLSVSNRCPTALLPTHSIECEPALGTMLGMGVRPASCRVVAGGETVAECRFVITVRSTIELPSITCPTNHIRTILCASNCVTVDYELPAVINGKLEGCTPPPGTCFPVGVTWITCLATNDCGDRTGCPFNVRVLTVPPVILCPTNEFGVFRPCWSNCVPAMYPLPEVRNGTLIECTPPPGSCLGGGYPNSTVYTVTCRATNDCGTLAQCTFPIRIQTDPNVFYPPDLAFPPRDYVFTNHCGTGCIPAPYSEPIIRHGTIEYCIPPPGTCLPVGTHRVSCRATNVCRLSASFSVNVQIVRGSGQIPVFTSSPSPLIVITNCTTNCLIVNYPMPTASLGATVRCTPPPGTCFPVGRALVSCAASNECGFNFVSFRVYNLPFGPGVKPLRNMVLGLPFDEPLGPVAHNLIPGAPNGIHVNGPMIQSANYFPSELFSGIANSELLLDGTNDFVRVPHYSAIGLSQSDLTIDALVARYSGGGDISGRRAIVSKVQGGSVADARGYELYLDDGEIKLDMFGTVAQTFSSGKIIPGGAGHVTVTVSRSGNGSVRFYYDGLEVAALPGSIPAPIGNSASLLVGASSRNNGGQVSAPFRGWIDEVQIFDRALTADEIAWLKQAPIFKRKFQCAVPWVVPFPPDSECVNVPVRVCNNLAVPQTIIWTAAGPMPIPTPGGSFVLPPFSCEDVPVNLCRPTNGLPVGAAAHWTFTMSSDYTCPVASTGSVVNPGPQIGASVPNTIARIPGTNSNHFLGVLLNGLPPGQPVRLRVMGPDTEPGLGVVSLDGLPPGEPVIRHMPDNGRDEFGLGVRFTSVEPVGLYTILIETDLDGDGDFDPFASFAAENPVAGTPTLSIVEDTDGHRLFWENEGDGFGFLQFSSEPDGPWETVPNAGPGYAVTPSERRQYFRVKVE